MRGNPMGAVYGTLTVGALLAAQTAQRETYAEAVGAVAVALVLYWLAHAYANVTATRLRDGTELTRAALLDGLRHEVALLAGAIGPLLVLLGCWIAGTELAHAVTAALWTAAGLVVAIELVAGIRAQLEGWELIVQTAVGALLGCLIIGLHLLLH